MRMRLRASLALLLLTATLLSFTAMAHAATATATTAAVRVGSKLTMPVTAGEGETLSWSSSDKKIAKVSNGVVTGVKAGTATITCKVKQTGEIIKIKVTVQDKLTSIAFRKSKVELLCGVDGCSQSSFKASVKIQPSSACKGVTYTSSNTGVAICDADGTIHAVGPGKCTITATSQERVSKPKAASCTVTVKQAVTAITLSQTSVTASYGERLSLSATAVPETAADRKVSWSTSDKEIAKVDSRGNVTIVGYGSCQITVKSNDTGLVSAVCEIVVPSYLDPDIYSGGAIRDELSLFSEADRKALADGLTELLSEYYDESDIDTRPQLIIYTCESHEGKTIGSSTEEARDAFKDLLDTEYDVRNKTRKGLSGPILITINVWQQQGKADVDILYTGGTISSKLGKSGRSEARSALLTGFKNSDSYVKGILYYAEYIMGILTGATLI